MSQYYGIYLCGDRCPTVIYNDLSKAKRYGSRQPHWVDVEILVL